MPTFSPANEDTHDLAQIILASFPSHEPVIKAKVKIDIVFAFADKDEKTGEPINHAITSNGRPALGKCRTMPLKDRAMGRGDAEIVLDGDHWEKCGKAQQRALLDHELHHIEVKEDERGVLVDDLDRPKLRMRKHDVEFGWFNIIAHRHAEHSCERIQAKEIVDAYGQFYWPDLLQTATQQNDNRFTKIGRDMATK